MASSGTEIIVEEPADAFLSFAPKAPIDNIINFQNKLEKKDWALEIKNLCKILIQQ